MLPRDQLVKVVKEDLEYIQKEWGDNIDDPSLRRGSAVLRRLLVQNELQRAWKAAGFDKEPRIIASTLTPILRAYPKDTIKFAAAGGAKYHGMELRGFLALSYAPDQGETSAQGVPQEVLGLKDFIEAPSVIVNGVLIPRRVVIKFVANKLGGAHFDMSRKASEEDKLFRLLDNASEQFELLEKNVVYFELLSTGQALAWAEDVQRFCSTG
jgi:hypothetical protein